MNSYGLLECENFPSIESSIHAILSKLISKKSPIDGRHGVTSRLFDSHFLTRGWLPHPAMCIFWLCFIYVVVCVPNFRPYARTTWKLSLIGSTLRKRLLTILQITTWRTLQMGLSKKGIGLTQVNPQGQTTDCHLRLMQFPKLQSSLLWVSYITLFCPNLEVEKRSISLAAALVLSPQMSIPAEGRVLK